VYVLVCPDSGVQTNSCAGPFYNNNGAAWIYVGYLNSNVSVAYSTFAAGGCSGGQTGSGMLPANILPANACLYSASADGNTFSYVLASGFAFGAGAAFTPPFDISQLNTVQAGQAFVAGFFLIAMGMFIGKPIALLLDFIRR
jgi:hypothetical protein